MTLKKPSEGKGRVKYNFVAQTPVELCLVKGEMVIIMRQVDEHWMEGRIGHRKGIFPISYIDVIQPPGDRQRKFLLLEFLGLGSNQCSTALLHYCNWCNLFLKHF